jgi:photosystem II stability/assembly factor-like uncharacterized protein
MGKNTQSAADEADAADESFDGGRIEAMASSASSEPEKAEHVGADGPVTAPGWTKRSSTRSKLVRALIVALAVIVALVALLPRPTFTLPPGIARLLTPPPTQTPQPDRLTTGSWEQVAGPPIPAGNYYELTPSLHDPATDYACTMLVSADAPSGAVPGAAALWLTRDAGQTWRQATLPPLTGASCVVSPARDGSPRVTVSVHDSALDDDARPCAHSQHLLSEDEGASWRRIQHAAIAPAVSASGRCVLWSIARQLFMHTDVYSAGAQGRAFLERSDDGGLNWARADRGLAELATNWYAQPLDKSGDTLGALVGADLWITQDAGASWRRVGLIAPETLGTGTVVGGLVAEASLGGGPKACHCVFALSYSGHVGPIAGWRVSVSHDYIHWSPLPPLPVTGASAIYSGVYDTLGTTADGKLLVLGAEPSVGVVATPDQHGRRTGPPPRLWAWDTHTARWRLAETQVPCLDLHSCQLYAIGASVVTDPDGALRGTMFWWSGVAGAGEGQPPTQTFYRLMIPAM